MNDLRGIIRQHAKPLQPLATGRESVLRRLPGIKAVLFDVYGTLFISATGDVGTLASNSPEDALTSALAAMKIQYRNTEAEGTRRLVDVIQKSHERQRSQGIEFPEIDIVDVWERVLSSWIGDGLIDHASFDLDFLQQLAIEYEARANPIWPMPNSGECLRSLREAGLHLGILSNAQFFTRELFPALLDAEVEQLGFHRELQFYSYQHQRAKPGFFLFELARDALATLRVDVTEVLYIGNDMLNDVYPAHKLGFRTALFAGDRRSLRLRADDSRVAAVTPDLVLTDLSQLSNCLSIGKSRNANPK